MRRLLLLLAVIAGFLCGCGASSPHVWVTPAHDRALTACASADCGIWAATLNWTIPAYVGQTGYNLLLNGSQYGTATSSPFTFYGMDCGTTFTLGVEAHNGSGGTGPLFTQSYTTPSCPSGAPVNTVAPTITDSTSSSRWATVDQLSATNGTWTINGTTTSCGAANGMVCAYQWQRSANGGSTWTNITDGDCLVLCQGTYRVQHADAGDTLRVIVTAGKGANSTDAFAAAVGSAVDRTCNATATSSATLATDITAASTGDTICLNTANYGAWAGTTKAITIMAAVGQDPSMTLNCLASCSNWTLAGVDNMSGSIGNASNGPANISIENSTFTGQVNVIVDQMGPTSNVLFDADTFASQSYSGGRFQVSSASGSGNPTQANGPLIQNSTFAGGGTAALSTGDSDGIQVQGGEYGTQILYNLFTGFVDPSSSVNHVDQIQFVGGTHDVIKDNFFYNEGGTLGGTIDNDLADCSADSYDGEDHNTIEGNVVWSQGTASGSTYCYSAIPMYSDTSSTVAHNTFEYGYCRPNQNASSPCGYVGIGYKTGANGCGTPARSPGSGTVFQNDVMTNIQNGQSCGTSGYSEDWNMCHASPCGGDSGQTNTPAHDATSTSPTYQGGSAPSTYAGFALASGSAGIGAASDGTNIGVELPTGYSYPR